MILPYLALLLFLLGQVGRLSFNQQEINVYLYEVPYFLWIIFTLASRRNKFVIPKTVVIFLGVLFATFLFGISGVTNSQNIVSAMYLVRLSLYLVGFGLTIDYFAKNRFRFIYLKIFIALMGAAGVIQYFLYSNLRNLQYLGWDPHQSRVFGQFLDTSVAGAIYGLVLIFLIINQNLFSKVIRFLYVTCYMLLGVFTYSRGFLLSVLASALSYGIAVSKNTKAILATLAAVVVFAVLAPTPFGEGVNLLRTSTIESRIEDYDQGLKLWQKNPVLGVGYNRIRYFKPVIGEELRDPTSPRLRGASASHAGASFHSSYLVVLVTAGVVGFGAFSYWLWTIAKLSSFAMIAAIFLGVYSLVDNILLHPFILFLWPVLIGVTSRRKQ